MNGGRWERKQSELTCMGGPEAGGVGCTFHSDASVDYECSVLAVSLHSHRRPLVRLQVLAARQHRRAWWTYAYEYIMRDITHHV